MISIQSTKRSYSEICQVYKIVHRTNCHHTSAQSSLYFNNTGAAFPAFSAAMFASFWSLSVRICLMVRNRRMNINSTLFAWLVFDMARKQGLNIPLFRHHKQTLYHDSFRDLWCNAFEQSQPSFMLNNKAHDLAKGLEWYTITCWWRPRLQTNLCDDQWLCGNCS